jgi:tetratricopeptide (TPR) repeat protein
MIDKSIHHYKRATEINPNKAEYFYNLGNALSIGEHYQVAILEYDNAIKLDPSTAAPAYFNKGNSHYFLE